MRHNVECATTSELVAFAGAVGAILHSNTLSTRDGVGGVIKKKRERGSDHRRFPFFSSTRAQ